jgi:type IV pilus assembly protein PilA
MSAPPPPLPPGVSAPAQPPSAPAPKSGMSGCAIAAIVGAVVVVVGIFLIGMLAAIALPAYQDYVVKSRVVQAYSMALQHQNTIDEQHAASGACPDNDAIGIGDDAVLELGAGNGGTQAQAAIDIGETDNAHCGISLRFANVNPMVDGKTLVLVSTEQGWTCDGGTLDAKYRPRQCFNPNLTTESSP